MFKKFNAIVILFFFLKNYSEGAPKKRKGEISGQQTQESEGGSTSATTGTLGTHGNYSCEWEGCGQIFDNRDTLLEHVYNEHIGMEEKDVRCGWTSCRKAHYVCPQEKVKQHFKKHVGLKPYVCEYAENGGPCNQSFTRKRNLKTHQRRDHAGETIIYKCAYPHCESSYLNYDDKVKHEKTHINPNHYGCPVFMCPKQKYKDPTSLRKHVCTKHGENVWDFIIANKKAKKANGYGPIGISEDGTPYDMLDGGAGSSDPNREVEVGQIPQGIQEHLVHPAYPHEEELHLFPTNVEHQENNQNEDYLMQDSYINEDVDTDLTLYH